jgi:HD superfamily phosphodiesterase
MNKKFKTIWEKSLPYQDKRDDKGHALIVTNFAEEILKFEKGDENIVIPAAILHDIGWSQIPENERMSLFNVMPGSEKDIELRIKHQIEGVKLAKIILEKVNYDSEMIKEVLAIISEHDTRKDALSLNDSIVRDADKLWMFSPEGFQADLKRREISSKKWKDFLVNVIGKLNTETAKDIAKRELILRSVA